MGDIRRYAYGEQSRQLRSTTAVSLAEANALLGGPHSTPEAIRAAFTSRVKATHPDAGGKGADFAKLVAARDLLLEKINQKPESEPVDACKMCAGRGRVGSGFGVECTVCHGTGESS